MRRWSKRAGRAFRLVSRSTGTCWPMSAGTKSKPTCSKPEWCSRPPPPPTNRACYAHHHEDLGDKLDEATKKSVEDAVAKVREALKGNDNDAVESAFDDLQAKFQEVSSELYKKVSAQAGPQRAPQKVPPLEPKARRRTQMSQTRSSRWSTKIRRRIDRNPLTTIPAPPMRRPGLTLRTNQLK